MFFNVLYMLVILFCLMIQLVIRSFFFFFNDTATTEIYTLSLHDALPIYAVKDSGAVTMFPEPPYAEHWLEQTTDQRDRKSTRLNSSHSQISYAVFCLKKKKKVHNIQTYFHEQHTNQPPRFTSIDRMLLF